MLSAGTTSIQGDTPKFLLTQGKDGLWYADAALDDNRAARHFLVKLSPGRYLADWKMLENEAAYMKVAQAMGLFVPVIPEWHSDMLFMPRFDRAVTEEGVVRYPQESLVSLCQIVDGNTMPSQNQVVQALRQHTSDPVGTTLEYLKRDIMNRALGNTDNHPGNTAVQSIGEKTRLAPLFDFAPSHLLPDDIARPLEWVDKQGEIIDDWGQIPDNLDVSADERRLIRKEIQRFGDKLARLEEIMRKAGVDDDIVEARYYSIASLRARLKG